jgi:threonylcarbamoyladenosine tRNA methylthiotransferase MtaB
MRRRYRAAGYRERIAAARARLPEVAVSADVIAGLPGETAADHGETIALIEDVRLARLHVFPYSPRPGTGTAAVDDVPPAVKRSRAAALRRLSDRLAVRHRRSLLGRVDLVLVERVEEESVGAGLGRDGTPWRLVGADPDPGAIVSAVAVGMLDDGRVDGRIAT